MTEVQGHMREAADGLRSRNNQQLREAIAKASSEAERRRLRAQLRDEETPPVDPEVGRTTDHGW